MAYQHPRSNDITQWHHKAPRSFETIKDYLESSQSVLEIPEKNISATLIRPSLIEVCHVTTNGVMISPRMQQQPSGAIDIFSSAEYVCPYDTYAVFGIPFRNLVQVMLDDPVHAVERSRRLIA